MVAGLSAETTYYFILRSADDAGNLSAFSNVAVVTTDSEIPAPQGSCAAPSSPPSQFSASEDSGTVVISWAPASDPLASAIHVWRGVGRTGPLSLVAAVSDPAQTVFRDASVRRGKTYRYRATWAAPCGDGPATAPEFVAIPAGAAETRIHAYPNPSRDAVRFVIHVPDPSGGNVKIRLFDLSGRVIADIADGPFPSGDTVISWPRVTRNGDRVAPGYYESIGSIGDSTVRERLILLP